MSYNPYGQAPPPQAYGQHPQGPPVDAYGNPIYAQPAHGAPPPGYGQGPPPGYGQQYPPSAYPTQQATAYVPDPYSQPPPKNQGIPVAQPAPTTSGTASQPQESSAYNDVGWAILFIVHLIGVSILGVIGIQKALDGEVSIGAELSSVGKYVGVSTVVSLVWAFVWFRMMGAFPREIIKFALILQGAFFLLLTITFMALGIVFMGIVMLFFLVIYVFYVRRVQSRIPFSSYMLESAVNVVKMYPSMVWITMVSGIILGAWLAFWGLGVSSNARDGEQWNGGLLFLFLISVYWVSQVIDNVVHVTNAGLFAEYSLKGASQMSTNPTGKSFKRATTTSFGSICLGSLIVATLKAIRTMVQMARNERNAFAQMILECIIRCIEQLIEYFNFYAFVQVAIYGMKFTEAARATWALVKEAGIDALINDDLVGTAIWCGGLIGGIICGVLSGVWAHVDDLDTESQIIYAVVGFLIGIVMVFVFTEPIVSGVATFFVVYAQMAMANPEMVQKLERAAAQDYAYAY